MTYDFSAQVEAWHRVPVDDVGYLDSRELLTWSDEALRALVAQMEFNRYTGWRNHGNLWRSALGLDDTHGKHVLDFGCGVGLEALQFAKLGCSLTLADISIENLDLAGRVLRLYSDVPAALALVRDTYPFFEMLTAPDVFYANGSLHHVPYAREVLERACEVLAPGGEIRLMLYSDRARDLMRGRDFVRAMDEVGSYADWYDVEKIDRAWGDFLNLERFTYITHDERYCAVTLVPREA